MSRRPPGKLSDEERAAEAKRILDTVSRDTESVGASSAKRMADRARDHMMGADGDQSDPAEVWGRRVGRGLSLLLLFGLMYYLAVTYL
ncbi:MAG: hypothetical protein AAF638_04540 [Pseudomonadota bacterium]